MSAWRRPGEPTLSLAAAAMAAVAVLAPVVAYAAAAPAPGAPAPLNFPAARQLTPAGLQAAAVASRFLPPPPRSAEDEDEKSPPDRPPGFEQRDDVNDYPRPAGPGTPSPPAADVHTDGSAGPQDIATFSYPARIARSWEGLADAGAPGDPDIAAGPNHVLAVVNIQLGFYDKAGTLLSQVDERSFFGLPTNTYIFDAKVSYDTGSGRFFVMAISRDDSLYRSYYHLAVSQTNNPTQGWWVWASLRNDLDTNWIDYPELGVSNRAVYFTGNYLNTAGDPWPTPPQYHGATLWIINKTTLLSGGGFGGYKFDDLQLDNTAQAGSLTPAQAVGLPAGAENFVVAFRFLASVTRCHVWGVTLPANFPTGAPTLALQTVDGAAIPTLVNAPQLGGPAQIESWNIGAPPFNVVYRNGRLWTVTHAPGGAGLMVRHFEFDVSAWPALTIASSAGLASASRYYFWPAVNVNSFGDVVMGFTSSSGSEYCGARFATRFAGDAAFGSTGLLKAGEDYYGRSDDQSNYLYRWGDYSGVAVDPSNQGLWVHHMYAATRPDVDSPLWKTWIGYVPRAVFVDLAFGGSSNGTRARPWLTVSQAATSALAGNDVVVKAGTYTGALTITKAMTLISDGGSAVIGP